MPRTSNDLSVSELQHMIQVRHKELEKLEKQRGEWRKELDRVEAAIAAISGNGNSKLAGNGKAKLGRPTARAQNASSLAEVIYAVLSEAKEPMGIGEIAEKVLATGYRSTSASFRTVVNVNLIKDKRFAKAGRGLYQMAGGAKSKK